MAQTTLRTGIRRWTTRSGWVEMVALAPRPELEQAALRLGIGSLVLVGLLAWQFIQGSPTPTLSHMVWFLAGFVTFAVVITLWMLAVPQVSPARLVLGIIADNVAITYFMLLMGEGGALVVGIYFFVAFGNGFRFGRLYLCISHGIAILGFTLVIFVSEFWSQHLVIGAGLLLTLLALPLYVGVLAERLKAERLRAEQELKECREALKECRARERGGS